MRDQPRLAVRRTPKLFIGGKFPRSESGRSYPVSADSAASVHISRASRKDARDAVVAARKAQAGWAERTPYNRGQVLYRVAELMEGRREQFVEEVRAGEGARKKATEAAVDAAIDRWVWYAGWADKLDQVDGAANPVAGPFFNFSVPEPTGVVAVVAPRQSSLLGLVSVLAPVIVTGNTAVMVASEQRPLPAISLTEVLATSDVPGGVVNVLTGYAAEIVPVLARHMDVGALDLTGLAGTDEPDAVEMAEAGAENVKRVIAPPPAEPDWHQPQRPSAMLRFTETKTVWHPMGR